MMQGQMMNTRRSTQSSPALRSQYSAVTPNMVARTSNNNTTMPPLPMVTVHESPNIYEQVDGGQREQETTTYEPNAIVHGLIQDVTVSEHNKRMKDRVKEVYYSSIQNKCKFLPDYVLHMYDHDDPKHISQVVLNGIGMDPTVTSREEREDAWSKYSVQVKLLMQDHRNLLSQKVKKKVIEGKHTIPHVKHLLQNH
jgi:hypothetical protein